MPSDQSVSKLSNFMCPDNLTITQLIKWCCVWIYRKTSNKSSQRLF